MKIAVLETRLDGHEDICAKRYGEIAAAFSGVQSKLEDINGAIRKVLLAAIVALLGLLGTVFYSGTPWQPRVVQDRGG